MTAPVLVYASRYCGWCTRALDAAGQLDGLLGSGQKTA
jgi:hypothetical protein